MNLKRDYTTKELAEKAGVGSAYIRQLLIEGTLRGYKRGRDWLIEAREAERWLKERERH